MSANRTNVPTRFKGGEKRASIKQVDWILRMLEEKDLFKSQKWFDSVNAMDATEYAAHLQSVKDRVGALDANGDPILPMREAGLLIDALKPLPKAAVNNFPSGQRGKKRDIVAEQHPSRPRVQYEMIELDGGKVKKIGRIVLPEGGTVLAGSYGLPTDDDDRFKNDMSFFKVWINEDYGRGWGVKMYVSDDLSRVSLALETQMDVLWAIAQAPEPAAANFGHEFKRCGVCMRGLTNDESRQLGIGPVCRGRLR